MIAGIKKSLIGATGIVVAAASLGFGSPAFADDDPGNLTLGPGQYSGVPVEEGGWTCNMMATGKYAPCVQDTQTTGAESWYKGYKLTFNWEVPLDWHGNPYERCVLSYYNPATSYNPENMAPLQIDVPASWGSYTIPLARYGWLEDGITAGASTLKQEYYCYTDGVGASERTTSNSALIPDMAPTVPTDVDATSAESNVVDSTTAVTVETGSTDLDTAAAVTSDATSVDLLVSGSKALGVSQLDGYQLDLTNDATGATVADVNIAPKVIAGASRVAAGTAKSAALNGASSTVKNLQPGNYTLKVASYNRIGASDPYTVKLVVKKGGLISTVKQVKVKVTGKKVTASWTAVKGSTGYVVQALRGNKIIKQVTLGAKAHATSLKLAKGSYKLRVANLNGQRASTPKMAAVSIR